MIMPAPYVSGTPGGFARKLSWRYRLRASASAFAATVPLFTLYQFDFLRADTRVMLALLVASSVAGGLARHWWGSARAASVGSRSERRVAERLVALSPVGLLHSVDLHAGGDADHLLLGPWLTLVETKTGAGSVSYRAGKLFVGRKPLLGDPLAQCRRQAAAARKEAGSFCDAVVCVVDMVNAPFEHDRVTVCSLADLPSVIARLPHRLDSAQALNIARRLSDRTSTVHERRPGSNTPPDAARPASRPAFRSSQRNTPPVADITSQKNASNKVPLGDTAHPRKLRPLRPPSE